jgi:hypothetical protein
VGQDLSAEDRTICAGITRRSGIIIPSAIWQNYYSKCAILIRLGAFDEKGNRQNNVSWTPGRLPVSRTKFSDTISPSYCLYYMTYTYISMAKRKKPNLNKPTITIPARSTGVPDSPAPYINRVERMRQKLISWSPSMNKNQIMARNLLEQFLRKTNLFEIVS